MDRSFCLTRSTFHGYCLRALILCLTITFCDSAAHAQGRRAGGGEGFRFGGDNGSGGGGIFSGADFLRRMDRNEDGRLDEDEVPDRMRGLLESQGFDLSEGIDFDEFEEAREGVRTEFQSQGSGGGWRGWGGGEEGDRDRGDRDRRGRDDDDDEDDERARPRITFDLPASHTAADTDRDGQLGMYEWRRWSGHSLREFLDLDGNGDGFVTPRELYVVIGFPDQDSESGTPGRNTLAVSTTTSTSGAPSSTPGSGSSDRLTEEARRYFGLLDKDDDGALSTEEWGSSIRIRGMFEEGNVDLSEPTSEEAFVEHYVRLSQSGG